VSIIGSNSVAFVRDVVRNVVGESENGPSPSSKLAGVGTADENLSFNAKLAKIKASGPEKVEITSNFAIAGMAVSLNKKAGDTWQVLIKN
jgi:hypothetical protein